MIEYFVMKSTAWDNEEMDDSNIDNLNTHEKIQSLLDEIKEFENKNPEYPIVEPEIVFEEVPAEIIEDEDQFLSEPEERGLKTGLRRFNLITIRKRKKLITGKEPAEVENLKKVKEIKPTTFKIGFDEDGNLVNLDLKKPKIKEKSGSKSKRFGGLKKLARRKKGEKAESEGESKESKTGRFKGALGKVGKLKKVVPSRGRKKEKEE